MNGKELLIGLGYIRTEYFEEAECASLQKYRTGKFVQQKQNVISLRRSILIASLVALMLLLAGCAVLIWSLADLKISNYRQNTSSFINQNGDMVTMPDIDANVLTIHGLQGSPVYQAHQEWYEFTENYDTDHTLMNSYDNMPLDIPEDYEAYSVYTQEMMDKVDEIAEKHNLKLLGAFAPFQSYESHVFYEAVGINSLLVEGSDAKIDTSSSGKFYEGGNFDISFRMTMAPGEGAWPYEMLNSMYYSKSDCFDDTYMVIGDWSQWEQWNYTTQNGDELLIMWFKDGGGARIFCNREDALICVSVEAQYMTDFNYETSEYDTTIFMTKEQLKQVADQIDFSIRVDNVNMNIAREKLEKFKNQKKIEAEKDPDGYTAHIQKDYGSFIQAHLDGKGSERYIAEQFALWDIDGDGTEELLLGNHNRIFEIVYMVNGKAQMVHDGADESNEQYYAYQYYDICKDGKLLSYLNGNGFHWTTLYSAEDRDGRKVEKTIDILQYAPDGEYPWARKGPEPSHFEPISEKEYNDVIAEYQSQIIPIEMLPISAFFDEHP